MNAIAFNLVKIIKTIFSDPLCNINILRCVYVCMCVCNIPFYLIKDNFVCLSLCTQHSAAPTFSLSHLFVAKIKYIKHTNN